MFSWPLYIYVCVCIHILKIKNNFTEASEYITKKTISLEPVTLPKFSSSLCPLPASDHVHADTFYGVLLENICTTLRSISFS